MNDHIIQSFDQYAGMLMTKYYAGKISDERYTFLLSKLNDWFMTYRQRLDSIFFQE